MDQLSASVKDPQHYPAKPTPDDFDVFLPWAIKQLVGAEYAVIITRASQAYYASGNERQAKYKQNVKQKIPTESSNAEDMQGDIESSNPGLEDEYMIYIETTYNDAQDLVRIEFKGNKLIPRVLFKVIALILPYQQALSSLISNKGVRADSIHEISKYYPNCRITELCLDNCYVPEQNYHLLLDNSVLKHLSLSRCYIVDATVKLIAAKLQTSCPASKSLSILNLSTNRITDVGAEYLSDMLRSNRQLSYLNLAHNRITDTGAIDIFDSLQGFFLTNDEALDKSRRFMDYLNHKNELILTTIAKLRAGDYENRFRKKSIRIPVKKKLEVAKVNSNSNMKGILHEKAEAIVKGMLGEFVDPFSHENTVRRENELYCFGNNTMCYLNLAYNNLTHLSLKRLCELLRSQNALNRKPKGLVSIRIDGNYLPENCQEYDCIDELLLRTLATNRSNLDSRKKGPGSLGKHHGSRLNLNKK